MILEIRVQATISVIIFFFVKIANRGGGTSHSTLLVFYDPSFFKYVLSCWRGDLLISFSFLIFFSFFLATGMSIPARGEIVESENPLDVLSRAATMVEKSEISPRLSPPLIEQKSNSKGGCERSSSFKERTHPKFRKSSTPDYMVALESARSLKRQTSLQSEPPTPTSERMDTSSPNNNTPMAPEDVPLDMSIKKRPSTSPPPPPQYRFNPLRQHSPPPAISSMNPSPPSYRPPAYKSPPPYPATPSPPGSLPPPPSYEESTVKCTYPTKNTPPPAILQEVEQKTKIKEITIITSEFFSRYGGFFYLVSF